MLTLRRLVSLIFAEYLQNSNANGLTQIEEKGLSPSSTVTSLAQQSVQFDDVRLKLGQIDADHHRHQGMNASFLSLKILIPCCPAALIVLAEIRTAGFLDVNHPTIDSRSTANFTLFGWFHDNQVSLFFMDVEYLKYSGAAESSIVQPNFVDVGF